MKITLFINRDGRTFGARLLIDEASAVLCTVRAREKLLQEMEKIGAICSQCGLVTRSDELIDGRCSLSVGCGIDVDRDLLNADNPMAGMLQRETLFDQIWRTFTQGLSRDLNVPSDLPEKENGAW